MHRLSQIHIAPFQKQTMLGAGSKSSSELIEDGVPSNPFFPERATLAHSPPPNLMMDCGPEDVPPPLDTVAHISLRIPLSDTSPVGLAPKTAFCHISLYRALGGSVMSKSLCSGSLTKPFLWGSCPVRHSIHAGM